MSISLNSSNSMPVIFIAACQVSPGALNMYVGSILYVFRVSERKFSKTSARKKNIGLQIEIMVFTERFHIEMTPNSLSMFIIFVADMLFSQAIKKMFLEINN